MLINTNITQLKDNSSLCVNNISTGIKRQARSDALRLENFIFSPFKALRKKLKEDHNKVLVYSIQQTLFLAGKYKFSNKKATKNVFPLRSVYLNLPVSGQRIFDYIWSFGKSDWICPKNETIAKKTCCSISTVIRYKRLFIANGWMSCHQVNTTEKKYEVNRLNKYTPFYYQLHISPYWFKGFKTWKKATDFRIKALRSNQHQMPHIKDDIQNINIYINKILIDNLMPNKTPKSNFISKTIIWEELTKEEKRKIRVLGVLDKAKMISKSSGDSLKTVGFALKNGEENIPESLRNALGFMKDDLGYKSEERQSGHYSIHQERKFQQAGKQFQSSYERSQGVKDGVAYGSKTVFVGESFIGKDDPRVQEILKTELSIAKNIRQNLLFLEIEKEVVIAKEVATLEPSMKTMLLLRSKLTIQVQEEFKDRRANAKTVAEQDEIIIEYKKKLKDTFLANGLA